MNTVSDGSMNSDRASVDAFLMGGGEMGRRIRAFDWAASLLGPLPNWSPRLRSALSICLNSNFPIALYWRSDLVLLYNDEWSSIPGTKHPWVLGRPAHEAWPEIWHIIEPLFQHVFTTGEATRSRDQLLPMHRHGFTEECYFDYTFSPIRDEEGRVEGIFNAVLETTTRVISERRLKTLRVLSSSQATAYRTIQEACAAVTTIMAANPLDLPFAALYLSDDEGRSATLAGQSGLVPGSRSAVEQIDLTGPGSVWPLYDVQVDGTARVITELRNQRDDFLPTAWPESVREAVVLPMLAANRREPIGFLVVGISPRLALSDDYRGFLDLLASHTTAVITGTQTYIEERRRAEELAELDRAKTVFFSNISHEFRTPLTLMLSPLEELLAAKENHSQQVTESLRLIHRNGVRLSRLVNTLLDFSRIEAGRVQAKFMPLDIAELTSDIVGLFRSAIEWAGIELRTICTAPREPVYVDPEMWETVS
ncbi:MAG: histidine kinase dimerization/phospho-acceptor domain-containing protein [Pirellulales bacterium]